MILGYLAEPAALKKSHRQIETRRTILTLIVAIWEEIYDHWCHSRIAQNVGHGPVDLSITAPALLVGWPAVVSDHGDNETVFDALTMVFIACEPRDCTDRAGGKQEAVAVACP